LRKAIKIKAYIFFFAWVMIFSHNIIPHNHFQEESTACYNLINNTNHWSDDLSDLTTRLNESPNNETVCHISNILFNNFNPDNLIFNNTTYNSISIVPVINLSVILSEPSFISDYFNGSSSLRSPPAV
jgi:hypothetical protein